MAAVRPASGVPRQCQTTPSTQSVRSTHTPRTPSVHTAHTRTYAHTHIHTVKALRIQIYVTHTHRQLTGRAAQDNNVVVKTFGEKGDKKPYNHVDLVQLLDIADLENGTAVAGGRGYFLKGAGVLLNQALINFALQHAYKRGSTPVQTPFFMRQSIMKECAQLEQFDEELYHVRSPLLRSLHVRCEPCCAEVSEAGTINTITPGH